METCIDYTDYTVAVVSTDEPRWHKRLRAYAQDYPDQVRIKYSPETNDGNMVAEIPVKWVRIKPPKRVNMSDEQRAALSEKMRILNAKPDEIPDSGSNEEEDDEE